MPLAFTLCLTVSSCFSNYCAVQNLLHTMSGVTVRREAVVLPTYQPCPADPHPQFIETRVYQGSSGKVYPLPFIDRIEEQKRDQAWDAVWLENEFVQLMVLPELGGRIHIGKVGWADRRAGGQAGARACGHAGRQAGRLQPE
jgi:hypothetical protein